MIDCSAGVGRAGTFLLIDTCLRLAIRKRAVDVRHQRAQLRTQIASVVDNPKQYMFAHLILLEFFSSYLTMYPCDNFHKTVDTFCDAKFEAQMAYVNESVWQEFALLPAGVSVSGARPEPQLEKNRVADILPETFGCVRLRPTSETRRRTSTPSTSTVTMHQRNLSPLSTR